MASTPTKAELRALPKKQRKIVARELAREERAAELRRRRRARVVQRVTAGAVAIAVVVAAVLGAQAWVKGRNRGPMNMIADGVLIGGDGTLTYASSTPALVRGGEPEASIPSREFGVLDTVLYVDYSAADAGTLWTTASGSIVPAVTSGQATLEIHPLAPGGSESAVLAGAALGCVAENAPVDVLAAHEALLAGTDWTTSSLVDAMTGAGIDDAAVTGCIESGRFTGWVKGATARAKVSVPFDVGAVDATTLLLAGVAYDGAADDATAFTDALSQAWATIAEASQALTGGTDTSTDGATVLPVDPSATDTPTPTEAATEGSGG